jgi:fibronectin type 3 domain-containing protein
MSKKRTRKRTTQAASQTRKRIAVPRGKRLIALTTALALGLFAGGMVLARRTSLLSLRSPSPTAPTPHPQAQQLSLAKEYIYAGGRLLATEEGPGVPAECSDIQISPSTQPVAASGGPGTFYVSAQATCSWTASTASSFIHITSGSGSGNGQVDFTVDPNTGGGRSGTITVFDRIFTVTQEAGDGCSISFPSGSSATFTAAGESSSFTVHAAPGCNWTATTSFSWILITGGASGVGDGSVSYTVLENTTSSQRSGQIVVGGQHFVITQSGTGGCTYYISPTEKTFTSGASGGVVSVSVEDGCSWTGVSNASWIRFGFSTSGTGNGSVSYDIDPNTTGSVRIGTMTIAGLTFTVTQNPPCTYSVTPAATQVTVPTAGISNASLEVDTQGLCEWDVNVAQVGNWITTQVGPRTGPANISYSVAANPGGVRTGGITISGQGGFSHQITITQNPVADGAGFVTQDVQSPLYPAAGQTVSVTMANIGSNTWSQGSYVLRSQNPPGNTTWGITDVPLPSTVPSGAQVTFTFTIHAPDAPGSTFDFQWQMYKVGASYFGDLTPNVAISVSTAAGAPGPTNLTATPSGTNINLAWQNQVSSNYITVERKVNAGSWSQMATVSSTATSYVDPALPAGSYTYRVRCFVGNGESSPYSNEAGASIGGTAPARPTDLLATAVSGPQVSLTWTDNSNNETGFVIERKTGSGSYGVIGNVGVNATLFPDTTVAPNTTYTYRVKAVNGTLESDYSDPSTVTTGPPSPPAAPSDLTTTLVAASRVDLAWIDNSNNEDGFKVERKTGAGSFGLIATLGTDTTSYQDTTVAATTAYTYRVLAYNSAGGDSGPSNELPVTTQTIPAAPSNLVATAVSSSQINLTWTDNSSNEQGFKIERKIGSGSFTEIATVGANANSYSNTGLTASTQYTYQVRAYLGPDYSGYTTPPAGATTQGSSNPCPTVTVFSGNGTYGYGEGSATSAKWRKPVGAVIAKHPTTGLYAVFIADTENHRIRMVYLEGANVGVSSLIAGDGTAGYSEGSGSASNARYNNPRGIAATVDGQGKVTALLVADTNNHVIRKLAWSGGNWVPSLFCGKSPGAAGYTDGAPTNAKFNSPQGIVVASDGLIYVADSGNSVIRKLTLTGTASTLGGGPNVGMVLPVGITASGIANGPLYVSDASTQRIFRVTLAGGFTIIAGSGTAGFADGTGTAASFNAPQQLAWANPTGGEILLIADRDNHRIRRLVLSTNAVNTHAGSGTAGFVDGSCSTAKFNSPQGAAYLSSTGALYVVDTNNNRIRKLQ